MSDTAVHLSITRNLVNVMQYFLPYKEGPSKSSSIFDQSDDQNLTVLDSHLSLDWHNTVLKATYSRIEVVYNSQLRMPEDKKTRSGALSDERRPQHDRLS